MKRWAIINDWHIPKHDKAKVKTWFDIMRDWQPDAIDINGDFMNMESVGRWVHGRPEEYVERLAMEEAEAGVKMLSAIRALAPEADMVYREGNHEKRLREYVSRNAPALADLVTLDSVLRLTKLGIAYRSYDDAPDERFGGYHLHHGSLADVGREIDKYKVSMICGHSHRLSSTRSSGLNQTWTGLEGGHMVDLSMVHYQQHFNWQHGFLYGYYNEESAWLFEAEFKGDTVIFDGVPYGG